MNLESGQFWLFLKLYINKYPDFIWSSRIWIQIIFAGERAIMEKHLVQSFDVAWLTVTKKTWHDFVFENDDLKGLF